MAIHEVKIGGEDFTVQRFKGLKAILAIAAITRIARDVPDIIAKVSKEYGKRNTITLTPEMAKLPRWQGSGFTQEDFEAAGGSIELPARLDPQESILAALPELLDKARKEVIRLLAILITPNQELKEADKADNVEEVLDKHFDLLMYESDLDELADLALAASDVLEEQLGDKKDRLGKLLRSMNLIRGMSQSTRAQVPAMLPEIEPTPRTSPDSAPTSSPDSDTPSGGAERTPSTESLGVN